MSREEEENRLYVSIFGKDGERDRGEVEAKLDEMTESAIDHIHSLLARLEATYGRRLREGLPSNQ